MNCTTVKTLPYTARYGGIHVGRKRKILDKSPTVKSSNNLKGQQKKYAKFENSFNPTRFTHNKNGEPVETDLQIQDLFGIRTSVAKKKQDIDIFSSLSLMDRVKLRRIEHSADSLSYVQQNTYTHSRAEQIVSHKINSFDSKEVLFEVKWDDFDGEDNTYEPFYHLHRCLPLLKEYLEKLDNKKADVFVTKDS